MSNLEERAKMIQQHLRIAQPYSEATSEAINGIKLLTSDIQEQESNLILKAKLFSELAAYYAGLAAQQLTK